MPLPHINSLYTIVMDESLTGSDADPLGLKAVTLKGKMSSFAEVRAADEITAPYDSLPSKEVKSNVLIQKIFHPKFEATREKIFPGMKREAFAGKFGEAQTVVEKEIGDENKKLPVLYGERIIPIPKLLLTFQNRSFPETFFHPHIADELCNTGLLSSERTVEERLTATAGVIIAAFQKKMSLAMMLGMSTSHQKKRNKAHYTEDTVEFTLLTFSVFGAEASGLKGSDDWFFYWRVFGSMMGLPPERLHSGFDEANTRMNQLYGQCPQTPTHNTQKLLNTFADAFLSNDGDVTSARLNGLISLRMDRYLKEFRAAKK